MMPKPLQIPRAVMARRQQPVEKSTDKKNKHDHGGKKEPKLTPDKVHKADKHTKHQKKPGDGNKPEKEKMEKAENKEKKMEKKEKKMERRQIQIISSRARTSLSTCLAASTPCPTACASDRPTISSGWDAGA